MTDAFAPARSLTVGLAVAAFCVGCGGTVANTADSAPVGTQKDSAVVDDAETPVADAQSDAPIACASGYDCSSLPFSEPSSQSLVPCCADKVCRLEPYDDCTDADAQLIQASNYDQSCTMDTDCVAVAEGNFCYPGAGNCPSAAISKSDYARYQADTARTRAAACLAPGNCGAESGPCCIGGQCQMNVACFNAVPVGDASADAGTDAARDGGPTDAAAD